MFKKKEYKRIPRKLKKKVKKALGCHWPGHSNGVRMWCYTSISNPYYHRLRINKILNI